MIRRPLKYGQYIRPLVKTVGHMFCEALCVVLVGRQIVRLE